MKGGKGKELEKATAKGGNGQRGQVQAQISSEMSAVLYINKDCGSIGTHKNNTFTHTVVKVCRDTAGNVTYSIKPALYVLWGLTQ